MSDVTQILSQIESGNPSDADQLLPLVHEELRQLATAKLAHEKPGQALQATALVHEAYLRLVNMADVSYLKSNRCWSKYFLQRIEQEMEQQRVSAKK